MGIVFVDWNLVWVWGLKIRGGKSLLMGIADWNFSLLMGIVFLGNPEKEKSLGSGSENQRRKHVVELGSCLGSENQRRKHTGLQKNTVTHCLRFKKHSDSLANTETSSYLFFKKN